MTTRNIPCREFLSVNAMERVHDLHGLVLPRLTTNHLLFILNHWPCIANIDTVMDVLCERDLTVAIRHLLGLPYSHGHREGLKQCITKELTRTGLEEMRELGNLFPRMTALVQDSNGDSVAKMGPLTDFEAGLWDSQDFYFHILHAKQMKGTFVFPRCCMSLDLFVNARLSFS